jgi:transposase InsO family protein
MLNLGHGRSPLWCGSQNHYRDLRPGYGRLLRNLRAAQAAITFNCASFPTCYGPEYISGKLLIRAEKLGISIQHIQPGLPQQNAYIERYNRTVRHEWLDQYIIETIEPCGDCGQSPTGQRKAQDHATQWLWTYNNDRPNMGIGGITPAQKLKMAA